MDYLLSLVKHHKNEVDQALQSDPTLKAEVDYDLRQYEKAKKEAQKLKEMALKSAEKRTMSASRKSIEHISPYLPDVHPSSIKKPLLKAASSSSKSTVKISSSEEIVASNTLINGETNISMKNVLSATKTILSSTKKAPMTLSAQRAVAIAQYDEDPIMRLTSSQDVVNAVSNAVDDAYEQIAKEGWILDDDRDDSTTRRKVRSISFQDAEKELAIEQSSSSSAKFSTQKRRR